MDLSFKKDIEEFLNQPEVLLDKYEGFKIIYCLCYNLKDKPKLISLFKSLDQHFVKGIYNGPKDLSEILGIEVSPANKAVNQKKKKRKNKVKVAGHKKPKIVVPKTKKHPRSYYHLLKLKRIFLNKNITLREFAKELKYNQEYYLTELSKEFPGITLDSKLTEEHLKHGIEDFYYDYFYLQNKLNDIVTIMPKTKKNYYKLIYTR